MEKIIMKRNNTQRAILSTLFSRSGGTMNLVRFTRGPAKPATVAGGLDKASNRIFDSPGREGAQFVLTKLQRHQARHLPESVHA